LREFVVWERNTIWREMIGKERRVTAAGVKRVAEHATPKIVIRVPRLGRILVEKKYLLCMGCLLLFLIFLLVPIFQDPYQQRCLALLVLAASLWASEVHFLDSIWFHSLPFRISFISFLLLSFTYF
jgi:phosphate transporter